MNAMRPARNISITILLLMMVLLSVASTGCAQSLPRITISGLIQGDSIPSREQGQHDFVPIMATISCGGQSTRAASDGTFHLTASQSDVQSCRISDSPYYVPLVAIFPRDVRGNLTLSVGPLPPDPQASDPRGCKTFGDEAHLICTPLALRPGTLSGNITYTDTHQPAASVQVMCLIPDPVSTTYNKFPDFTVQADAHGHFLMTEVPVDRYICRAGSDVVAHITSVAPAQEATLSFSICHTACPSLVPHNGPVIHKLTVYIIFWLPKGYVYDTTGSPASFQRIITQYFKDIGGTRFYNIVTQYWDRNGPIQNSVTIGGIYMDQSPYRRAATQADPLLQSDIEAEVKRVAATKRWPLTGEQSFFVYTGYGAETCTDKYGDACSFGHSKGDFCGYHAYNPLTGIIFAEIPDTLLCVGSPYDAPGAGPNGNRIADHEVSYSSHEQFELVTDPEISLGWYDENATVGEIADKCESHYAAPRPDGSTVTLNGGHHYFVQSEWSDVANACVFGL